MAETNLSKEQFQALLEAQQKTMVEAITAAVTAARAMNPLEKKAYEEEIKKEKRRALLAVELGKAEAEKRWRQQTGCSHSRDKQSGLPVARGTGTWTTGGQVTGLDVINLVCLRCSTRWEFKATPQEIEFANNAGLLGFPPPPIERCLNKAEFEPPILPSREKLEAAAV